MQNIQIIDSILEVKASGSLDVTKDLDQTSTKTIAELLYEQKEDEETT